MSKFQHILYVAMVALLATSLQAQQSSGLSTGIPDSRTLKVQRKVNDLFERGEYDRAYFIYRNELVPIGDKYAQYMVGFMHLTGMGTDEDPIAASAWYRLAAERGTPQFIAVRDLLMGDLLPEQRRQSDLLFMQIRREFSDLVILLDTIKRHSRHIQPRTGSRISSESGTLTVIDVTRLPNQPRSSGDNRRRAQSKLEGYLVMLSEIGDFPDMETNPSRFDIDEVERLVNERLDQVPE